MKELQNTISSTSSSDQTISSPASSSAATTPSKTPPSINTSSLNSSPLNGVTSTNPPLQNEDDPVEYMEIDTTEEPTSSQKFELTNVSELVKKPIRLGDHWYILNKKWYDACLSYIESNQDSNLHPGKIDNSPLLVPVKNNAQKNYTEPTYRLKPNLTEGADFTVVHEDLWNLFIEKFGIVIGMGGNIIRCPVLENGKNYNIVEIYPLEVRLSLYGSKDDMVAQYSRNCSLQKIISDMRSLFRVDEKQSVQLWNNATLLVSHDSMVTSGNISNNDISSTSANIPPPPPPPPASPSSGQAQTSPRPSNSLEQCLLELDLAPNSVLTLELQNPDGTWPSSRTKHGAITRSKVSAGVPITDPGVCGLMNLGNTCFMNSALQCLSNTPPLTNFLYSDRYLEDINVDNPLGMGGEIARRYAELIKAMWSGHHVSLSPREFKIAVSRFAPQFSGFAQHDCQELMAFLLDGLHEDLNRVKEKPYIPANDGIDNRPQVEVARESWENYKRRNDSIIVDTFHAQLKSTLVCPACNLVSVTFDPFCYLTLPLPFKRERSVDVVFVPAISKRPSYNSPKRAASSTVTSATLMEGSAPATTSNMISLRSILLEGVMIPKTGIISEISCAVARMLNETVGINGAPVLNRLIDPTKLRVANVYMNRLNKLFSSEEVYTVHFEDVVVYEEDDSPVSTSAEAPSAQTRSLSLKPSSFVLPVFLREINTNNSSEYSISRPFLINIKHLTYEDIREAILQELLSLVSPDEADAFVQAMNEENAPEDSSKFVLFDSLKNQTSKRQSATTLQDGSDGASEASDADEEEEGSNKPMDNSMGDDEEDEDEGVETNGYSSQKRNPPPYTISVVNTYGTSEFSVLRPGVRLDSFINTYLSINIHSKLVSKYFPSEINTYRQIKLTTMMPSSSAYRTSVPKTSITLGECINQFTTTEKLGSDDPWYCPRCKEHQMASKKFDIWTLPNILIIHLKRFQYSRLHRDKLDVFVEFPVKDLDMTSYLQHNPNNEIYKYNLIGVANHFGGLGGGHYTAYGKNAANSSWYNFDDSSVSAVSENSVITKSAYVLYYELQKNPEASGETSSSSMSDASDTVVENNIQ